MARHPRLMPTDPRLFRARVVRSVRRSPSFARVTVAGPELDDFAWGGRDHWFRLFLPQTVGAPLVLPAVSGRSWWKAYLAIDEHERPHCSNYTVADVRRGAGTATEMDIDVVLHWDVDGQVAGGVAVWADSAVPGEPMALLDQGVMFDPPPGSSELLLVADETGLPALRGIVRDLPADAVGRVILEVPDAGDVEQVSAPPGVEVLWLFRGGSHAAPGERALDALRARLAARRPAPEAYGFVVGESTLATEGRRALVRAGLPASRITFSGFWKHAPEPALVG